MNIEQIISSCQHSAKSLAKHWRKQNEQTKRSTRLVREAHPLGLAQVSFSLYPVSHIVGMSFVLWVWPPTQGLFESREPGLPARHSAWVLTQGTAWAPCGNPCRQEGRKRGSRKSKPSVRDIRKEIEKNTNRGQHKLKDA